MDKKPVILLLFLLLNSVVAQGSESSSSSSSSATTLLDKFRRMVGIDTIKDGINPTNATQISPSPSPIPVAGSDLGVPVDSNFPPAKLPPLGPPTVTPPNHLNPSGSQIKEDSNQQGTTTDNCEASSNKCRDQTMIACLQHPKQKQMGIQEFILLVQNEGESSLKVNIIVPASVEIDLKELQIPKHQVKKINVVVKAGESPKIVLNAGYGDCVLQAGTPIFQRNIFPQIPSYTTLLTPVYGAYFVFLIALIVGGIWACCKFGKRGRQQGSSGIPYQELEMGMTGSSGSAINVDTADGWDQSWDDDWDEDRAVVSPGGGQHVGNVSANGLTARSSNKDGLDNDWDE